MCRVPHQLAPHWPALDRQGGGFAGPHGETTERRIIQTEQVLDGPAFIAGRILLAEGPQGRRERPLDAAEQPHGVMEAMFVGRARD